MEICKMFKIYYKNLICKNFNEQIKLVKELLNWVGLFCDRKLFINDFYVLEQFLDCWIVVLFVLLGNWICYKGQGICLFKIYLYFVDDDYFYVIILIIGFFSIFYFCMYCLKFYND